MAWYWYFVILLGSIVVGALMFRPPRCDVNALLPDHERCEAEVDGGDRRCRDRATAREGNRELCDKHARIDRLWRD